MKTKSLIKWVVVTVDDTEPVPCISYCSFQTKKSRNQYIQELKNEGKSFVVINKNLKKFVAHSEAKARE